MEQAQQMQAEKRSVRRFSLNLPVRLKNGSQTADMTGLTRDVSSRGAFVQIDPNFAEGAAVEFLMTLPAEITLAEPIRVRCHGKVLRVENAQPNPGIAVAIEKYDFVAAD